MALESFLFNPPSYGSSPQTLPSQDESIQKLLAILQAQSSPPATVQPEAPSGKDTWISAISDALMNYASAKVGTPPGTALEDLRQRRQQRADRENQRLGSEHRMKREATVAALSEAVAKRDKAEAAVTRAAERAQGLQDQRLTAAMDDARRSGVDTTGLKTAEEIGAAVSVKQAEDMRTKRAQEIEDLKAIETRQAQRDIATEERQAKRDVATAARQSADDKRKADADEEKRQRLSANQAIDGVDQTKAALLKGEELDPETVRHDFLNYLDRGEIDGKQRERAIAYFKAQVEPLLRHQEALAMGEEMNRKKADLDREANRTAKVAPGRLEK